MVGMDSTQSVGHSPISSDSTSSGFAERLKTRDPQAWQQLAEVYGPVVYFWCRKYGVKSDDAADIFQEVFGSVAAAIGRFRREQQGGR
jgi:RNA polymerase sigma-70 factor (ECF subfamily)